MAALVIEVNGQEISEQDLEKVWKQAVVYENDDNPWIEQFKFRGRYHGQYHDLNGDTGDASGWEDRRSRFGIDVKFLNKKGELRADFQSNDSFEDLYDGLVDAYLRWKPRSGLNITLGKIQPLIAYHEWLVSINELPIFERSQIFNQANINRATGLTVEGDHSGVLWQAGIYSNDTPPNAGGTGKWGNGEWGDLSGGFSTSLGMGYDFKEAIYLEKALFRIDWIHSERDVGDRVFARYDDMVSVTMQLEEERWTLSSEIFYLGGGDYLNEDVIGFYIMPTYDVIVDQFQVVGRFSYSHSDGPAGLLAQARYEREISSSQIPGILGSAARGDEYLSVYLGCQYFIYGQKLKLMGGLEWANLTRSGDTSSYNGITLFSGVHFFF